jgi:hypothetical protein
MGLFSVNDKDTIAWRCSVFVVECEQAHLTKRQQDFSVLSGRAFVMSLWISLYAYVLEKICHFSETFWVTGKFHV